jgi:hypothetical protein
MKDPHEDPILYIMEMFAAEYADKFKMSEERTKLWRQMLKGTPPEVLLGTAYHLVSTRPDWPPDIARVRKTAMYVSSGELKPMSGPESWERIMMKIQRKEIELTDTEREALKQTASIYDLRRSQNMGIDRARYIQAFEGVQKRREDDALVLPEVRQLVASQAPALESGEAEKRLSSIIGKVQG